MRFTIMLVMLSSLFIPSMGYAQTDISTASRSELTISLKEFRTLPESYESSKLISDNLYLVGIRNFKNMYFDGLKYGLVDSLGNIVLECIYNRIHYLTDDKILVQRGPLYFDIYNRNGVLQERTDYAIRPIAHGKNKDIVIADPFKRQLALMNQKGEFISNFRPFAEWNLPKHYDFFNDYFEKGTAKLLESNKKFRLFSEHYARYYELTSKDKGVRIIEIRRGDNENWQVQQEFTWHRNKNRHSGVQSPKSSYLCISFSKSMENVNCPKKLFRKLKKEKAFFEQETIFHSYNQYSGAFKAPDYGVNMDSFPILEKEKQAIADRFKKIENGLQQSIEMFVDTEIKIPARVIIRPARQSFHIDFKIISGHIGKVILVDGTWYLKPGTSILLVDTEVLEDIALLKDIPVLGGTGEIIHKNIVVYYGRHKDVTGFSPFYMRWARD